MLSQLSRASAATGFLARKAVRAPREFIALLRSLGGSILDTRFEEVSPISVFPRDLVHALGVHQVVVPPASLFRPGNQDVRGLIYLVSLASALGARTIFEIGTYNGLTALTLARNLPLATVHTLDIPAGEAASLPFHRFDYLNLRTGARVFKGTPEAAQIIQHWGDSAKFNFTPFGGCCELVYVDGSHSVEYVSNDSKRSFEIVAPDGAIVWDDYWRLIPGVPAFLHTIVDRGLFRLPGSRLVVWLSDGALHRLRSFDRAHDPR